jgi:DNA-binding NarL/FixJ family response regulator
MSNTIKVRHNVTGQITEKSELNWQHLPKDRKELYTVIDGNAETSKPFSPPELKKTISVPLKKEEPKEPFVPAVENTPAAEPVKSVAEETETQDQQIIRLHNSGKDLKEIAKEVGAHWKSVDKVINNFKAAKPKA